MENKFNYEEYLEFRDVITADAVPGIASRFAAYMEERGEDPDTCMDYETLEEFWELEQSREKKQRATAEYWRKMNKYA